MHVACSQPTEPPAGIAVIAWLRTWWRTDTLHLALHGISGCDPVVPIEIDVTEPGWDVNLDLTIQLLPQRYSQGCDIQVLDTAIAMRTRTDGVYSIWSPFPREPGMRLFARTAAWWDRTDVGGIVQLDTLPTGCWVLWAPGRDGSRTWLYAYDSSFTDVVLPLNRGRELFVSGCEAPRIGCDRLQVLYIEAAHIPR